MVDHGRIFHLTLSLEGEVGSHPSGFVISPNQQELLGVTDLQGHQVNNNLDPKFPSVDIVPEE